MTATGTTHPHLTVMKRLLAIGLALSALLISQHALADEVVDSGWVEIDPLELEVDREYERIIYRHIKISENPAIQTDALRVLKVEIEAANKTEENIFFDLGVIGEAADGETLFVFNLSPTLSRISPKATTKLRESRYVLPGTLDRVTKYRVRFLGFK